MATLLGKGTAAGSAGGVSSMLTITLTDAVPASGVVELVFALYWEGTPDNPTGLPSSITDSRGNSYVTATSTLPLIGYAQEGADGPAESVLEVASYARACTPGDLSIGDTISMVWQVAAVGNIHGPAPANFHAAALAVYLPNLFGTVKQGGEFFYANGDGFPSGFIGTPPATYDKLDWTTDAVVSTTPDTAATMVTAMAAYPATAGFTPLAGALVGEDASGGVSIACAAADVAAGSSPNPGGTWGANASLLSGNYQYVSLPGGARIWQRI